MILWTRRRPAAVSWHVTISLAVTPVDCAAHHSSEPDPFVVPA